MEEVAVTALTAATVVTAVTAVTAMIVVVVVMTTVVAARSAFEELVKYIGQFNRYCADMQVLL